MYFGAWVGRQMQLYLWSSHDAQNVVGFDCEFVEPPPERYVQSECPVCLHLIREPHQVTCCGKKFCKSCIEHVQENNSRCPTCKAQVFKFCFPDKGHKLLLYGLKVRCSHQKDGCEWTGELRQLDEHLNTDPLHETIQSKLEPSHGRLKSSPVPGLKGRGGNEYSVWGV